MMQFEQMTTRKQKSSLILLPPSPLRTRIYSWEGSSTHCFQRINIHLGTGTQGCWKHRGNDSHDSWHQAGEIQGWSVWRRDQGLSERTRGTGCWRPQLMQNVFKLFKTKQTLSDVTLALPSFLNANKEFRILFSNTMQTHRTPTCWVASAQSWPSGNFVLNKFGSEGELVHSITEHCKHW